MQRERERERHWQIKMEKKKTEREILNRNTDGERATDER